MTKSLEARCRSLTERLFFITFCLGGVTYLLTHHDVQRKNQLFINPTPTVSPVAPTPIRITSHHHTSEYKITSATVTPTPLTIKGPETELSHADIGFAGIVDVRDNATYFAIKVAIPQDTTMSTVTFSFILPDGIVLSTLVYEITNLAENPFLKDPSNPGLQDGKNILFFPILREEHDVGNLYGSGLRPVYIPNDLTLIPNDSTQIPQGTSLLVEATHHPSNGNTPINNAKSLQIPDLTTISVSH